ncbi:hypothetical protein XENORESO_017109 [Xenotaenia resolanae]|uniref:Uncharacterized protein n=1 Tax=Xenotaenia resolanae TaxID=208358 RepID=A0ABV0WV49_9TELE
MHDGVHAICSTTVGSPTAEVFFFLVKQLAEVQLVPVVPGLAHLPSQQTSTHTAFCKNYPILHTRIEKERAEYPQYATLLCQQKKEKKTIKKQAGRGIAGAYKRS